MKKTVLILYSDRYDTSAVALKEYLEDDGKYDVVALNESKYDSMRLLKTYNGLYKFTYRKSPFFNNVIVNLPTAEVKRKKDSDGNIVAYKPNSETFQRWRKFDNIAMRFDADYVICTSQYTIKKAVIAKEKYRLKGKIFALLTDYALQDNFVNFDLDGYFVITKRTKDALVKKGLDESKIYIIDMPLPTPAPIKRTNEEIRKQFDIRNDLPIALIVGGRYGSKYVYDALLSVCDREELNLLVMLDGNISVQRKFERWSKKNPATNNVYFVQSSSELTRAYFIADYVISAPTAAICYETLLRKIPLILMDGANNVENKNAKHLIANGFAYSGINKKRIDKAFEEIDKDNSIWAEICDRYFKNDGAEQFLKCLDIIDEGKNPNEEYLNRVEVSDDKEIKEQEEGTVLIEEKKRKKKFFFKRK